MGPFFNLHSLISYVLFHNDFQKSGIILNSPYKREVKIQVCSYLPILRVSAKGSGKDHRFLFGI